MLRTGLARRPRALRTVWSAHASFLAALALLVACGSDPASTDDEAPDGLSTLDVVDVIAPDAVVLDTAPGADADAAAPEDAADAADTAEPDASNGELGDPCTDDADCDSGFCISTFDGRQCTEVCNGECPDGWDCLVLATSGGDFAQLCVPVRGSLCRPCTDDIDCGGFGALCMPLGDGDHCGAPCDEEGACPLGYTCDAAVRDGERVPQ